MATKKPYRPKSDAVLVNWLQNLVAKIDTYSAKYNLTAAEVTKLKNGAAYLIYWIVTREQMKDATQNLTAYKNEVRDGVKAGGSASVPPADILFTPPVAVDPGVLPFILSLTGRIKAHQGYTTADGEQLGIEGAIEEVDLQNIKPEFTIELRSGHPYLNWTKGVADAVKIMVLRGGFAGPGNPGPDAFTFLALDTEPGYLDSFPLPPFNQSTTWIYIMVYVIDDEVVGLWSEPAFITVTGTP